MQFGFFEINCGDSGQTRTLSAQWTLEKHRRRAHLCKLALAARKVPNSNVGYSFVSLDKQEMNDLRAQIEARNLELDKIDLQFKKSDIPESNSTTKKEIPVKIFHTNVAVDDDDVERSTRLFQKPMLLEKGEKQFWQVVRQRWAGEAGTRVGPCRGIVSL